ncbi:hypothetical protein B0A49_10573 [Cryomyces minteri]|uniref:Phospholipid-transporting ATPase n=1 Tax=Cryomyces minteri TaxID=331657 RepID=A0A4V5NGK7_9PEZI|nr:hypothetical protein B0A49_10573 [Cryomyces minteri]
MSAAYQYHQPNAPDSPRDDQDSDLDLDLEELDPVTSTNPRASPAILPSREKSRVGQERAGRIPLRSLRHGGGSRRYGRLRKKLSTQDEDLEGLLNAEEGAKPDSAGSSGTGNDDTPLLSPRSKKGPPVRQSAFSKLGSSLMRLPGFRSRSPQLADPQIDAGAESDHPLTSTRTVSVGLPQSSRFPPNAVSNAKYTPVSFLPRTLYNEFSFFFNMYFLLVALSQTIPALRIGYISTYVVPLAFVLAITLGKEALDDIARRRRDAEANSEGYTVLKFEDAANGFKAKDKAARQSRSKRSKGKGRKLSDRGVRPMDIEEEERATHSDGQKSPTSIVRNTVIKSRELKVGDVLKLEKDQRIPADVIILKSYTNDTPTAEHSGNTHSNSPQREEWNLIDTDAPAALDAGEGLQAGSQPSTLENMTTSDDPSSGGEAFIRTDQLDGETDWKLRLASPLTQSLDVRAYTRLRITAGKPDKKVNDFVGTIELLPRTSQTYDALRAAPTEGSSSVDIPRTDNHASKNAPASNSSSLTIDNTAWANTVLASSSTVLAVVIYTGPQTRQALSTSPSRSKTGLLENEINSLTKILCFLTLTLSFVLVALEGFESKDGRKWYVAVMRFLILFSTIVPISLRVNLDMGKSVYAWFIERDQGIPGTVVRTSTIPEDLGRVEYLLSDKTGTLTQNEMELKKIHVGTVSYANEAMDEVSTYVRHGFAVQPLGPDVSATTLITPSSAANNLSTSGTRTRREIGVRVLSLVLALALCHNVTPTTEEVGGQSITTYQASSPDEIAIVRWTEAVGLRLLHRDRKTLTLQSVDTGRIVVRVQILNVFPFTSDGKRMGIVVRFLDRSSDNFSGDQGDRTDSEICFFQKGADTVMTSIVASNDWLDEETANMAREGLRTLVVGRKRLSPQQYQSFSSDYTQASLSFQGRDASMASVVANHLERDLELLGVTGVEDKLQKDVKPSLELLRNAGIKIWMLTGDKPETARCVAVSARLVSRNQSIHTITKLKRKDLALDALTLLHSQPNACLLIDGESLQLFLTHHQDAFIEMAVRLPAVIACRCSPTQKADVARLIKTHTRKRICCIGDGGNDVSMIQAADVGVGIVGKEGRQASLAADFSITAFSHLTKLLVWHGRNSYKRSAKLAQFVIHRGLLISVCQTVFSVAAHFEPIALYRDWLLVGYATLYTMAPVFSLVLDRDVDEGLATLYPELYKELTEGRSLSYRTFFVWLAVSVYQGCAIQGLSQLLVATPKTAAGAGDAAAAADFSRMVAVSFTALVVNELVMVAAEVTTWHPAMLFSILGTAALYLASVPFLGAYFDLGFVASVGFLWRVVAISAVSLGPVCGGKALRRWLRPPSYRKVQAL